MDSTILVGSHCSISLTKDQAVLYYASFEAKDLLEEIHGTLGPLEIENLIFIFPAESNINSEMAFKISKNSIHIRDKEKLEGILELLKFKDIYFLDLQDIVDRVLDDGILMYSGNSRRPIAYVKTNGKIYQESFPASAREFLLKKIKEHGRLPIYSVTTLFKNHTFLIGEVSEIPWINVHMEGLSFLKDKLNPPQVTTPKLEENVPVEETTEEVAPKEEVKKKSVFSGLPRFRDSKKVFKEKKPKKRGITPAIVEEVPELPADSFELISKEELEQKSLKKKTKYEDLVEVIEPPSNVIRDEEKGPNYSSTIVLVGCSIIIFILTAMLFKDERPVDPYYLDYQVIAKTNLKSISSQISWSDDLLKLSKVDGNVSVGLKRGYISATYRLSEGNSLGTYLAKFNSLGLNVISYEESSDPSDIKVVTFFAEK